MMMADIVHPSADALAACDHHGLRGHYLATLPEKQCFGLKKSPSPNDVRSEDGDGVLADPVVERPSIALQPNWEDFMARTKRLAAQRSSLGIDGLPDDFPLAIEGERVWSGRDIASLDEFIVQVTDGDVKELESALAHFKDLPGNNGPDQVSKELFPLPTLGRRVEDIGRDLHAGRGLKILRGLNPQKYTPWENVVMFAGLASHLAEQRGCQDRFGNMLTHLVDMGFKFGYCSKRTPTFTAGDLPYHNDVCDILAMYIQECAPNGGESTLSPSATVYNEIAATRPDVIKTLSDPIWVYDKDKPPAVWNARPILFPEPTHGPFFCFSRQKLTGSEHYPLSATLPAMSEAQAEALDLVHYVAEKHGVTMKLCPGDILLYNNLALLHGRKAFTSPEDNDGNGNNKNRRHILRLWLRNNELAWETPQGLARDWHLVYGDSERRSKAHWRIRPEDTDRDRVIGHKMTCS